LAKDATKYKMKIIVYVNMCLILDAMEHLKVIADKGGVNDQKFYLHKRRSKCTRKAGSISDQYKWYNIYAQIQLLSLVSDHLNKLLPYLTIS
jgi:hypothetical protein